ncbi:MAG TPA: hypothetical protein VF699_11265 [Caulobacteraceae bacterium]|jgi:hypothetical protein
MTNTAPEKKGKTWLWALLAAALLIALVVFLMSRGGRADLDGPRQTTGVAEQGTVAATGEGTTADMDGDGQGAIGEAGTGETGPGTGAPAPNDGDGDGVPAGQEAGAGERR